LRKLSRLFEDIDLYIRLGMWIRWSSTHYARIVRNYLNRHYNDMRIKQGGPVT